MTAPAAGGAGCGFPVLVVINGLGTGGAERSVAELLPRLRAAGIGPTVACLHRRAEGVQEGVLAAGADVRFLAARRLAGRVAELRRLIAGLRPAVVHTTLFESDLAGRLAAAGTGAAVLTSLVNVSYAGARAADPNVGAARLRLVRLADAWTARHLTTHFHAITGAVKAAAVEALGIDPGRVTVIERGRDPARLGEPGPERRRVARRRLGLGEGDEVVLNVGRQEYQKGQVHLVEAVARLAAARPRLVLLVAGRPGHASAALERAVAAGGAGDRVRLLGHRDDVPDLLAAADVFAFPSLYEGLGGSVVEAMALGLPVVASDLPALREVVEPGASGLLVPPASPEALAAALDRVLGDPPLAARYGARGRAAFAERFTLDRSAARMIDLYRALAARGRRADRGRRA